MTQGAFEQLGHRTSRYLYILYINAVGLPDPGQKFPLYLNLVEDFLMMMYTKFESHVASGFRQEDLGNIFENPISGLKIFVCNDPFEMVGDHPRIMPVKFPYKAVT